MQRFIYNIRHSWHVFLFVLLTLVFNIVNLTGIYFLDNYLYYNGNYNNTNFSISITKFGKIKLYNIVTRKINTVQKYMKWTVQQNKLQRIIIILLRDYF